MKNKTSNGRLSYFFTPRRHGNVRAWVQPDSAPERGKYLIEGGLRWEDDGGPASETGTLPQVTETNSLRPKDVTVTGSYLLEDK